MDRKDEIIRLQNRILHEYAQHELKMIGNDLWGKPADPKVKKLHEKRLPAGNLHYPTANIQRFHAKCKSV